MYKTLPFTYKGPSETHSYRRLLVEPVKIPQKISDSGLIIPEHEAPLCEIGIVFSVSDGSEIPVGADVMYHKLDRSGEEQLDTVSIEGKVYDVLYENEIWSVNEKPWNQIFVRPVTDTVVSSAGVMITNYTKGFTQKGVVHSAPEKYNMPSGTVIEYRRADKGAYPQVLLDGDLLDVLFERDVFIVDGNVTSSRIIVKVDLHAQSIKRTTADSGLLLSPLFIHMLYNLQYAEVVDIGASAQKMYPELHVGDTAILHHSIEAQSYRAVKYDTGVNEVATYAYYIVNCWDEKSREILGKMRYDKNTGKILDITPLNGNVFMKWDFRVMAGSVPDSNLLPADNSVYQYHNLDDLRNSVEHQRKIAAEKAKTKTSGIKLAISQSNPDIDKDRWDLLQSEYNVMKMEETRVARYLRKDHLVICKTLYPRMSPAYVITPYEELYPINILGQKFLIAIPDFLIAKTHSDNMNIEAKNICPLGDNAFILPIEEEQEEGALLRPDSAKEKPVRGKVVAIEGHPSVKWGDIVLFRKQAGMEQEVEGVMHLILKHNDLLAIVGHAE